MIFMYLYHLYIYIYTYINIKSPCHPTVCCLEGHGSFPRLSQFSSCFSSQSWCPSADRRVTPWRAARDQSPPDKNGCNRTAKESTSRAGKIWCCLLLMVCFVGGFLKIVVVFFHPNFLGERWSNLTKYVWDGLKTPTSRDYWCFESIDGYPKTMED